ncbi:MAG: DNA gyrase subunit A [Candidatus Puniceispirillales bacterium]
MTDDNQNNNHETIAIADELRKSYLDYAMSVIVSRALPDVRDGLKPVHRRILYAMIEGGYDWSKPYKKSARIVGDVMGNYHPHGDAAIYDAMVRLAQDFSMRVPLIDGQGNFGSMDGDPAAAMRYTEARLAKVSEFLLRDINYDTVDYSPNYDESQLEPVVLPAEYPNLLVNGAGGIAVGMATNIPPHNPSEVIDACISYVDNPDITVDELMNIVPGPDFPTGALIMGQGGIRSAYETGKGSIVMRSKAEILENNNRYQIIFSEIPYQVNKAQLLERVGELVREKTIEGIQDLRDESDRDGLRVVVDIKRDADANVILNQLFRHTRFQTAFSVNLLALNNGRPEQMGLKQVISAFVSFREEVIYKRTRFHLKKARERAHILAGLMVALTSIDEVITLIRSAPDAETAKKSLTSRAWPVSEIEEFIKLIDDPEHVVKESKYYLSEIQGKAILELRLQRLTGMEREKLSQETEEIANKITEYLEILSSREVLLNILKSELLSTKEKMDGVRRTFISDHAIDADDEDLIQQEEMVVTVSHRGYIKRVPLDSYRAQRRGGKGKAGMKTRDEDFVTRLFIANTHTPILFFTSAGIVHQLKCYKLPVTSPTSMGKAMINLLPISTDENIQTIMPMPNETEKWDSLSVVFATSSGSVRRNKLSDFTNIRSNGKIAMKLGPTDRLIGVAPCNDESDIMLASNKGKAIRFATKDLRVFNSRDSMGVRGIKLKENDYVVSLSVLADDEREFILAVTENGFGKRSKSSEYRRTGRGGQGIANIEISKKNGNVITSFPVLEGEQLMLATDHGKIIRISVDGGEGNTIRVAGRKTQGVNLFTLGEGEKVVSVDRVKEDDEDTEESTTE